MIEIIMRLFEICLLKKGPQDLPVSAWLLRFLLVFYALVNFLILYINAGWSMALMQLVVEIILVLGFAWLLLTVVHKPERYIQTACALLGTDALISFFAIPAVATLISGRDIGIEMAFLAMLGLMLWHWAVTGHIIRHAISKPLFIGMMVALLYLLGSYQVITLLFPEIVVVE